MTTMRWSNAALAMPSSRTSAVRARGVVHPLLLLLVFVLLHPQAEACRLAGADTGVCTEPTDFNVLLPYCHSVVPYTACLPRYQSLWYNHTTTSKDAFVAEMVSKLVLQRKRYETDTTLQDAGTDEWGAPHEVVPRFVDNLDCENAFKNYFCWLNFPRCDAEGRSLLLCRSVCENYMTACQLSADLWRCGDPPYVNGREPERSTTWKNNELVYYRGPYPGSPFKDNAVDPDTNKPIVVCTPSLENTAYHSRRYHDSVDLFLPVLLTLATFFELVQY